MKNKILKQFLSNFNLLNIILMILIVAFVQYRLLPRLSSGVSLNLERPPVIKSEGNGNHEAEGPVKLTPQEYGIIADMNLFHPDRTIVKYAPPPPPEVKLPLPDLVLYGTLMSDSVKLAFIDDKKAPFSTPGGGRRHKTLKIGDTISGFTVRDIGFEKVFLTRNKEEIVLKKSDHSEGKRTGPQQPLSRSRQRFVSPSRSGYVPQRPQAVAPPVKLIPPTIITVPAIPVQATSKPPAQQPPATTPRPPFSRTGVKMQK